ncbi:MAG: ACT domain-containing protein [Clostridiales bacterium]|nr:ACT domain-containing protein [Clostridiales bacterium]
MLKQLSLFLENKPGRLANVCRIMAQEGINIRALSVADATDFGVLRLIVDDPDLAEEKLKARGIIVSITDVIGIKVPDRPGGLAEAMDILGEENISVEYMYAFVGKSGDQAMVILRLDDNAKGVEAVGRRRIELMTPEEVYQN